MLVKVETYKRRRQMEAGLAKLLNDGWALAGQSGSFTSNPWTSLFSGSRITVTLTKTEARAA